VWFGIVEGSMRLVDAGSWLAHGRAIAAAAPCCPDFRCRRSGRRAPLLTGAYATELRDTGDIPALVRRWLAVRRWRSTDVGPICPDHSAVD